MGCRSDYQEQTPAEAYRQLTARLLIYVHNALQEEVPSKLFRDSNTVYCGYDWTEGLCDKLKRFTDHQLETIVYANNRTARALANWWEDHQEADREKVKRKRGIEQANFTKKYGMTPDRYVSLEKEFYGWDREPNTEKADG